MEREKKMVDRRQHSSSVCCRGWSLVVLQLKGEREGRKVGIHGPPGRREG